MSSNQLEEPVVIIKYCGYTPAQKRATYKYIEANRDKINEKQRERYHRKKLLKINKDNSDSD